MPVLSRRRIGAYLLAGLLVFFFLSFRSLDTDGFTSAGRRPGVATSAAGDHPDGEHVTGRPQSRWKRLKTQYPVTSFRPIPTGTPLTLPKVQKDFGTESDADRKERLLRQHRVKDTFTRCWNSYREKAWMSDELAPVSGGRKDFFGGWGATLVDSLDTLWIMGMRSEFNEAVAAVANISFETSKEKDVNVFETNIRYLGGFLAAYDLSGDERLLEKAVEVGEMLYVAFDTPNRMPITRWNWNDAARGKAQVAHENVLLAEIGTFSLEFTRLSLVTGDPKWFDASQRVMEAFQTQQPKTHLPGLWPVLVNAKKMTFNEHTDYTLGAMADSLYEYLPKTYALVGGLLPMYREMYQSAMSTAIRHNLFRPMLPDQEDILVSGLVTARLEDGQVVTKLKPEGQHLVCFAGGMLALGGKLIENQTHVDRGEKLTNGCVWAYKASPLGIMPETFFMLPCESTRQCKWDEQLWMQAALEKAGMSINDINPEEAAAQIAHRRLPKGFTAIPDARYILRPEAIESVFILYRITGRVDLLESAWAMFRAIDSNTRTELANSALHDITVTEEKPSMSDSMESFWLGETLKYFYLVFSEPDLISLDEYVFNTEAHPLKRLLP
ncbi:glycoside hydrolase [Lasiosphaeris hirsuta]|uniref:alpha-1,2-Mannosidase n=1 Tax=Lasiosphaeris hirsuta TaxID=260670 RepID=A0AA40AQQ1_9PEZI|nr:glycoside hydrolase [Lasiosphaeris hirsuta]